MGKESPEADNYDIAHARLLRFGVLEREGLEYYSTHTLQP